MNTDNHGKVGDAIYLKYSPEMFQVMSGDLYPHGYIITEEEFGRKYGASGVPIHIDNTTQGKYECVCEHGVEVY